MRIKAKLVRQAFERWPEFQHNVCDAGFVPVFAADQAGEQGDPNNRAVLGPRQPAGMINLTIADRATIEALVMDGEYWIDITAA